MTKYICPVCHQLCDGEIVVKRNPTTDPQYINREETTLSSCCKVMIFHGSSIRAADDLT